MAAGYAGGSNSRWQDGAVRIVVDVTPLSHPRTGIGNFLRGLLAGLAESIGPDDEVLVFAATGVNGRRRVVASIKGLPFEQRIFTFLPGRPWRNAWNRAARPPVELLAGSLDVFHCSDWVHPGQRGGLRATTIYDLVPLRFPELVHPRTARMHGDAYRNAASCDVVFAISRFTAEDVSQRLELPPERIRVAYPGVDPAFGPEGRRADLGAPYVLTVSTMEPRKNVKTLLESFELLRRDRPELLLAIAGGVAPGESAPATGEGVRLLGYVPDDELAALYRGAAAFAYPSLFEGFGIPVVEALATGVPTVVSAHPSLDEAAGDAALRADPSRPESLADALAYALEDGAERREAGFAHAARFTWRACGEAVLEGYRAAL
jgi:glycosyltransferase involved in cell wall biosynthesis